MVQDTERRPQRNFYQALTMTTARNAYILTTVDSTKDGVEVSDSCGKALVPVESIGLCSNAWEGSALSGENATCDDLIGNQIILPIR
jgi:hypothetical protein